MASAHRPSSDHLTFLAAAGEAPQRWEPFALLRGIEARAPDRPRIGCARMPSEDLVEIAQDPAPGFAPAAISAIQPGRAGGAWRVIGRWLGLLGSMGPMPLHLSEYAAWEARYAKSRPFMRFLDLLARRMQQLFYRAWAEAEPAAQADRPGDDRFAGYIAQLTGAAEGAAASFPAQARLAYAALFASRRSAGAIEDALTHLLGAPVGVLEYQPRHRQLEPSDRSRLGRGYARLGGEAMLGYRVRTVTDAFRVVIRVDDAVAYRALLPGGARHGVLAEALDAFAPSHLEWDVALDIAREAAPPARLDGRTQLGWTSWIDPARGRPRRNDAHLRRASSWSKRS